MVFKDKEKVPVDLVVSFYQGILYQSMAISIHVRIGRLTLQLNLLSQQVTFLIKHDCFVFYKITLESGQTGQTGQCKNQRQLSNLNF